MPANVQYMRDPNHSNSSVVVRDHDVRITLVDPTDADRVVMRGSEAEQAVCHIRYDVTPRPGANDPCTWSGIGFSFCQSGRMAIRRGLPTNFPMPVSSQSHLMVRGVNT